MEFTDLAMSIAFLALPPILFFVVQNRLRGFIYSTLTLWILVVAGSQYHLAYTPDYDSMSLGISIIAGWIPASIYSGIWLGVLLLFKLAQGNSKPNIGS